jgi:hypothetical protein
MQRFLGVLAIAAMLLCGFWWSSAMTPPEVGQPLSESEALGICGGCAGAQMVACPVGNACPATTYWIGEGSDHTTTPTGYKSCGGNTGCSNGYDNRANCSD